MKIESKSAVKFWATFFFCMASLLCLSACASIRGPQWLTGEPDEAVLAATPRVVAAPSVPVERAPWPSLSDVPENKVDFSKAGERGATREALISDNLKAQADKERLGRGAADEETLFSGSQE